MKLICCSGDTDDLMKEIKKADAAGKDCDELLEKLKQLRIDGNEGFGKQVIERRFQFKRVPPILCINLQVRQCSFPHCHRTASET